MKNIVFVVFEIYKLDYQQVTGSSLDSISLSKVLGLSPGDRKKRDWEEIILLKVTSQFF